MNETFLDWKRHPITQVIFAELTRRYNEMQERMVDSAAFVSHAELAEMAGGAKAYRDILSITADEIGETHGN